MLLRSKFALFAAFVITIAMVQTPAHSAARFIIVNGDGAGEGFNDRTPVAPVGGNTGTTLGAQRLKAFQFAADIWGARLTSSIPIRVRGEWNPLSCSRYGAILGQAGPIQLSRGFNGAPVRNTWYPVALANALRGADLYPGSDDIVAKFNSSIGTTCAFPKTWYYGLDGRPGPRQTDFVTVLLHELGHGLGFMSTVRMSTGEKMHGSDDAYMRHLVHVGATPSDYPSMTNAQRVAASKANGNLVWGGAHTTAASGILTRGRVGNRVRIYAPSRPVPGSSISHFDTALFPNSLMEPSYTESIRNPVLEVQLLRDIGWPIDNRPTTPKTAKNVFASVLPYARAARAGIRVTAFGNILNASGSQATGCRIGWPTSGPPSGNFVYRAIDAANAKFTAPQNTPVNIASGAVQNFVFGFIPAGPFAATDVPVLFSCANKGTVASIVGVNTFLVSSSLKRGPDLVAVSRTLSRDGLVRLPSTNGQQIFVAAAVNIGVAGTITASADDGASTLPVDLTICQTNPATGACLRTAASSTTAQVRHDEIVTYTVFVRAKGSIPFDPAKKRLFLRLRHNGVVVGATHVALCTSCPSSSSVVASVSN